MDYYILLYLFQHSFPTMVDTYIFRITSLCLKSLKIKKISRQFAKVLSKQIREKYFMYVRIFFENTRYRLFWLIKYLSSQNDIKRPDPKLVSFRTSSQISARHLLLFGRNNYQKIAKGP